MVTGPSDFEDLLPGMLDSAVPGDDSAALIEQLRMTVVVQRAQERVRVGYVAELLRRGKFAARGYKRPESALANLLQVDRGEAGRLVVAAESVFPRTTLQGEVLEPSLPATAKEFAAEEITVRHVSVVAAVMGSRTAGRLAPHVWAHAEQHVAKLATELLPGRLRAYATEYLELLDQDGDDPDGPPPVEINELRASAPLVVVGGSWPATTTRSGSRPSSRSSTPSPRR
jgi:Domain of unknown function (DUF222)